MERLTAMPEWAGLLIAAAMFAALFTHMIGG